MRTKDIRRRSNRESDLKHTEIKLRQVALHLRDLKFNVDVDDQPLVQAAVDKLEDYRTEILKNMFGSKNND